MTKTKKTKSPKKVLSGVELARQRQNDATYIKNRHQ